ncbi:MAG: hypothetical protein HGA45_09355 [Chloroflexales bacterium]|nr:hypothetical protein [Chloroflexales bacterium]
MATTTIPQTRVPQLNRLQLLGIGAAVIGLALLALGFMLNPLQFAKSYIFGFYFSMAFPLGCLGFLMLQHLTGGAWGVTTRRMLEAGALAMPVFFILSLPVVLVVYNQTLGLEHYIYEWANPALVTPGSPEFDPIIAHKVPWMSPTWFAGRMLIYFLIWSTVAILLRTWSLGQDRGGDPVAAASRMRMLSGIGIALFVISVTFFAFDVGMSLDAHWYSTMYGAHYMENTGLTTLAFLILALTQVRRTRIFQEHVPIKPIHDLGKLMFAFTILWTYLSYGQFVIIWSADLAESVPWFLRRMDNGWLYVTLCLMICSFFAPFFALLGRRPKQNLSYLAIVATWIIVTRFIDVSWIILPEFHTSPLEAYTTFTNYAAPLGLFGIFLAIWAFNMQRASLLPLNDANMDILHAGGHH